VQDSKHSQIVVRADGTGLVSRAGVALLRELTISTGLGTGWSTALLDTYDGCRPTCQGGYWPTWR